MSDTIVEKIQELQKLQTAAAQLAAAIETERAAELAALPAKYGYDTLAAFIRALKAASGEPAKPRAGGRGRAARPDKEQLQAAIIAGQSYEQIAQQFNISKPYYYVLRTKHRKAIDQAATQSVTKRKYKKLSPELEEQIKAAVVAGQTNSQIAEQFGTSFPTIWRIKKTAGLSKPQPPQLARKSIIPQDNPASVAA